MENVELVTLENPYSQLSEMFRRVRTNLEFASLDKKLKVINVTSVDENETKSTTICNLAVMYANKFEKVLIIDADLRKANVHHFFKVKNTKGLADCMLEFANNDYKLSNLDLKSYVQNFKHDNIMYSLDILTAGSRINNPAEFLGSQTFKKLIENLKDYYDVILVDTAPSGIIVDGVIVSSVSDATLFVMGYGRNSIEATKNVLETLKTSGANVVGSLLTRTPVKRNFFKSYKEYGNYGKVGAKNE